ncbi:MAG: ribonuclease III [Candidatus Portnoybacteria bacterium RBG_19FT_COMBO_36_7]|uniref:Ribonuclease 3 n=1 Tax=Candidatus Portnoybacteria bacterium RBG_19FT_COMBO_36_7 TaxID=1801992 RepID=A0A1G2F861_9BACT|nr:MAG: ribonuclease III [Candidatus Portnoybacteria bacterium RBG_19FT_COMBO_36_7]
MMKDSSVLEKKIGVEFKNKELLQQSLTHRSYLNENPEFGLGHNERLEFLGDAVLELVVTEYLYRNYPNPEGELTNWRAALVNAKMLAQIAGVIGLNDYVLLSRGEAKDFGRARNYILANALEALIGAIYYDQGIEKATEFIKDKVLVHLPEILEEGTYRDAKSKFQEEAQERDGITPTYEVMDEWGPDHAKHFKIGVFLGEELVAEGQGPSKQEAQQKAAENALKVKNWNNSI